MRFCLAVPTYWTFPGGRDEGEIFFDHPTPLDQEGTLPRLLTSLVPLLSAEDHIVVVAAATHDSLAGQTETRVRELLAAFTSQGSVHLFSSSHLAVFQDFCRQQGHPAFCSLLSLNGYGAIRNLTLVLANLLGARALVSLDDDEIITDAAFLARIEQDLHELAHTFAVFGLAGLYETPQGAIVAPEPQGAWVEFWPKMRWLNEAVAALGAAPTLTLTPLALGGNMVISRELGGSIPFDPLLPRGEDTDYVLNARLFGIPFFLDPQLRVVHDPPDKPHPVWKRLRQDLARFWYTRQKLLTIEPGHVPQPVTAADFLPYPGRFLTAELELLAYRAHTVLALEYLEAGEAAAARETLRNLEVLRRGWPGPGVFQTYYLFVQQWRRFQGWLATPEVRAGALEAIWG